MQAQQQPRFTELEQAKLETCAARRQALQSQRVTISLLERENDEAEQAIILGARARTEAEDREAAIAAAKAKEAEEAAAKAKAPTDGLGNAAVVELRPGGPVEAPVAA